MTLDNRGYLRHQRLDGEYRSTCKFSWELGPFFRKSLLFQKKIHLKHELKQLTLQNDFALEYIKKGYGGQEQARQGVLWLEGGSRG